MGTAIEYRKLMTEIVYINLPGPYEPTPEMSGGELLHGFLAELYQASSSEVWTFIISLCEKWNIHYRGQIARGYRIIIEKAGDNFSAYSPDLPGCVATGSTREETENNMKEAIDFHIEGLVADGLTIH
jgi:predicted RNase H-like HicB family nuclease